MKICGKTCGLRPVPPELLYPRVYLHVCMNNISIILRDYTLTCVPKTEHSCERVEPNVRVRTITHTHTRIHKHKHTHTTRVLTRQETVYSFIIPPKHALKQTKNTHSKTLRAGLEGEDAILAVLIRLIYVLTQPKTH
jgi:hypothetical protein